MKKKQKRKITEEEFKDLLHFAVWELWKDFISEPGNPVLKFSQFEIQKKSEIRKSLMEALAEENCIVETMEERMKEDLLMANFQEAKMAGFKGTLLDYEKMIERNEALEDEHLIRLYQQAVSEGYQGDLMTFKEKLYPELKDKILEKG